MDKIKRNMIISIVSIFTLLTISSLILTIYNLLTNKSEVYTDNNATYKIKYIDNNIYNTIYDITINNNKVKIFEKNDCSKVRCDEETKETVNNYSKENMTKLTKFLTSNFSFNEDNSLELKKESLSKYQERVIEGVTISQYFFETAFEEYQYKIDYSENDNISYDIYLKNDKSILVKKCYINSDFDITKIDTYNLNFSKSSIDKIYEYTKKELEKSNRDENIVYKYSTLRKDEKNIINSIVNKDENLMKNNNNLELIYTISYNGINCDTPILHLYNDNTYEYYYTFTSDDKKLTPKTGTYNVDIDKIITNNIKSDYDYYTIRDENNNKNYNISENNVELHNFLKSINVKLSTCLTQE